MASYRNLASRTRSLALRASTSFSSTIALNLPPRPPTRVSVRRSPRNLRSPGTSPSHTEPFVKAYDAYVIAQLQKAAVEEHASTSGIHASQEAVVGPTSLTELVEQYLKRAGRVLGASLPYESRPSVERRAQFTQGAETETSSADGALVMVAHAVHDRTGKHKVAYSSGFAVHAPGLPEGETVYVTCAHTLEEIRHEPLLRAARPSPAVTDSHLLSGSFLVSGTPVAPTFRPITSVLSAMHRGDILLLSSASSSSTVTLPVNPYPVHPGTPIRAHFVADKPPVNGSARDREGWTPWLGGTWRKWVKGTVVGYRDYAGREAQPGTYDSLAHLHFDPSPTAGSSGGPIIDEESGSVIGVVLGTQLVNQVEGVRGWGVPAEMIFEMFSLPGLKLKSHGYP
ncbi:hypothetical protein C8Q74DRAFT_1371790 [Fomes fomentarius]|nr:hypothetical protein C8Q74DRAFT_1371790 [Fomes fomentarius]